MSAEPIPSSFHPGVRVAAGDPLTPEQARELDVLLDYLERHGWGGGLHLAEAVDRLEARQ